MEYIQILYTISYPNYDKSVTLWLLLIETWNGLLGFVRLSLRILVFQDIGYI